MRSRLERMKRVARMLRTHEPLLLNWFRAKGALSNGAVEGLINKIPVVTRRSYTVSRLDLTAVYQYNNSIITATYWHPPCRRK
jgi:transposase